MTKKSKIDFINKVNQKFSNASNHGNGNNWWYPKPNVIAYNVKMHAFGDSEELKKYLTERQKDFYTDDSLQEFIWEALEDEARFLSDDIDEQYNVKSGYAGRSGGWLEVEYSNPLEEVDETSEEIDYLYTEAQKLIELESKVSTEIKRRYARLNSYIDTPKYYRDLASNLLSDSDIAEIYKGKIKSLTDKLN